MKEGKEFKEKLDQMVKTGELISQIHPSLDLTIYNYSKETQFLRNWNEITLMCRGLVVNFAGEIVARTFPKFFNDTELLEEDIPAGLPFEVYEKMDGFLGILFFYEGAWRIASRGSFNSIYSNKASEILLPKMEEANIDPNYTYLFEIIHPDMPIVINYHGRKDAVLLAAIETKTGKELEWSDLERTGFSLPTKYDYLDYKGIKALNWENNEGFIIRFANSFRMKIKFENYIRLYSVIIGINTVKIWELLKEDKKHLISNLPDETWEWCDKIAEELERAYKEKEEEIKIKFESIHFEGITRSEFAKEALLHKDCRHVLFTFFDNQEERTKGYIWDMVKPKRVQFGYENG